MRDPLRRLPTTPRLWLAAALTVAPVGFLWSFDPGVQMAGTTILGSCDADGYCTPDYYTPGVFLPGSSTTVGEAPIRVFLAGAFAALVIVALRARTAATQQLARVGTGSLLVAAVLAAGHGSAPTLFCVVLALALAGPPAWRNRRDPAVFGTGERRR